jgi:acyl-CoA dehydrogenase
LPDPLRAALAKARASEAAVIATGTAHAVHGAIGITAELDLQLYTRRIHEWRADYGAETRWNRVLGRALLDSGAPLALDFMRAELIPRNEDIRP